MTSMSYSCSSYWKVNTKFVKTHLTSKLIQHLFHLSPCLNGDTMMRLHYVQIRVAPVLGWSIAGPSSTTSTTTTTITHVISPTVGVSTMVIPARWHTKEFENQKKLVVEKVEEWLLLFSPISSHAFLLGTHVMSRWGESLPTTSVVIPVLSTTTPFPASVPLPGEMILGNMKQRRKSTCNILTT